MDLYSFLLFWPCSYQWSAAAEGEGEGDYLELVSQTSVFYHSDITILFIEWNIIHDCIIVLYDMFV